MQVHLVSLIPFRVCFFGNFTGFCVPQPISSSLMSRYVPNAEDSQCFQPSKMKKCEVDVKKEGCRRMQ